MLELLERIQLDEAQKARFVKEVVDELSRRLIERVEKANIREQVRRGRITIRGLTDKLPADLLWAHASSDEAALNYVVRRIANWMQSAESTNRNTHYKDGSFDVLVAPQYWRILYRYLQEHPNRWEVSWE